MSNRGDAYLLCGKNNNVLQDSCHQFLSVNQMAYDAVARV